jgi:hypothetical protein
MVTKTKKFDCVKMKHDAQRKLDEEYEARRAEFRSKAEFLNAKGREAQAKIERKRK